MVLASGMARDREGEDASHVKCLQTRVFGGEKREGTILVLVRGKKIQINEINVFNVAGVVW